MARLGLSPGTAPGKKKKPDPRQRGPALRPGLSPPGKTKSRQHPAAAVCYRLRLKGSGSVFTIVVVLQFLQNIGKFVSCVESSSRIGVSLPQVGQTIRSPSVTNSLPQSVLKRKRFCPPFPVFK